MTHVHFIGIGGTGLSAIARLLLEMGNTVSGSDRVLSPLAAKLQTDGAVIFTGHAAQNVAGADWVVRSSAVPDDNPEVVEARERGIPVYKRADFLGRLMEDQTGIAVAGTHGKTTTTGMIAWMLRSLGLDPSFIVGSEISNLNTNAHAGKGNAIVIEADEYDRMFLGLKPFYAVVTNIEYDHPDCYPTFADMVSAFETFAGLVPEKGMLITCTDDPAAASLLNKTLQAGRRAAAYGLQQEQTSASEWMTARELSPNQRGGYDFEAVSSLFAEPVRVSLQVPGRYNAQNALAALTVAGLMGLSAQDAAEALSGFRGTARRFEVIGEPQGVILVNDYGHHPTEIKATLAGARARYPGRRIWAVWQPHTYSRTQALFKEFANAFKDADTVLVTEVYASREASQEFTSALLVSAMPHPSAYFTDGLKETSDYLLDHLRPGDVVIVFSAGNADQVSANVLAGLNK
jgi:UDP-N-acetylmuramate--alanine ligase